MIESAPVSDSDFVSVGDSFGSDLVSLSNGGIISVFFVSIEEIQKEDYNLSFHDIEEYRKIAKEIIYGDDHRIFKLLNISSNSLNDAYRKILYYVAEKCNNGREIRADFFN